VPPPQVETPAAEPDKNEAGQPEADEAQAVQEAEQIAREAGKRPKKKKAKAKEPVAVA